MTEHQVQTTDSYSDVVPPKYDLSYKWNIWDLKREAIQLVGMNMNEFYINIRTIFLFLKALRSG